MFSLYSNGYILIHEEIKRDPQRISKLKPFTGIE